MFDLESLGKRAKLAQKEIVVLEEEKINSALKLCAEYLIKNKEFLKEKNLIDIENAVKKGMADSFIDRLKLTDAVISGMADGLVKISNAKSPLGRVVYSYENEYQDIKIQKITVPFGVVGIIYESRPNVTADAFGLCFKAGNVTVLKGGSDSINSNQAVVGVLKSALEDSGVSGDAILLIEDTSRETTNALLKLDKYVDLLIPRGGKSLIQNAVKNATIPIIETGTGNCHVYIDEFADLEKAVNIVFNAKTQRYSVCNACESLVIHKNILDKALPLIANKLLEKNVEIRADENSYNVLKGYPHLVKATEEDFGTEFLGAVISIKVVNNLEEAISHVNEYSTGHSESIVTENEQNANLFMDLIDSSSVYHNASTRFSDGEIFGLGAEVGISTQKLHARGPMGMEALVTTKYKIIGNGSIRK